MREKILNGISVLLILTSCSIKHVDTHKLKQSVDNKFKKHSINNGHIIAMYGLLNSNNQCLYASDYGKIINDHQYHADYLSKHKKVDVKHIERSASAKVAHLSNVVGNIRKKYGITEIVKHHGSHFKTLSAMEQKYSSIPTYPAISGSITSNFGYRKHPIKKKHKFHRGVDIKGPKNETIFAAASGVVEFVGTKNGYGNMVVLNHGNSLHTQYAHLSSTLVSVGQEVIKGEAIGRQGNTGNSTNDHLHFEVLHNGKHVNPLDFVYFCNT